MLALMHGNIELNGLGDTVRPAIYNWGEPPPKEIPTHPDVILAADCVYFEPAFPLLEKTLQDLIGRNTVCYFCFKKRRKADLHFLKAIKKVFDVNEIEDDPGKGQYSKESIFLSVVPTPSSHLIFEMLISVAGSKFSKSDQVNSTVSVVQQAERWEPATRVTNVNHALRRPNLSLT
jgi:Lysine methyltransferase